MFRQTAYGKRKHKHTCPLFFSDAMSTGSTRLRQLLISKKQQNWFFRPEEAIGLSSVLYSLKINEGVLLIIYSFGNSV